MDDEDRRSQLRAKVEAVRLDFTEKLPPRLLGLRDEVLTALETDDPATAPWNAIRKEAHRLAGAGTTFGHPAVSRAATELERCLEKIESTGHPRSPDLVADLREAAIALGRLAGSGEEASS